MLSTMFSGKHKLERDKEGCPFIDRPGEHFGYILNYLRDRSMMPPNVVAMQVNSELLLSHVIACCECSMLLQFIVLEYLEHIYVTQTRIFLLFGIFAFYIFHFTSKNYLISCASSYFVYLDTYVCIFTLILQIIPCNWHIDKPWQHLPPYSNHVPVLSAPTPKLGQPEQSRYSVLGRSTTVMRIRSTWNNKWSSPQVGEARYSQVDNRKVSRVTSKRSCMLEGNFKFPTFSRSNNNFFFRIKNLLTNRGIN